MREDFLHLGSAVRVVPGGVAAPAGFRAAGIRCGLREGKPDLALIVSEAPASCAAVYTSNRVRAAPLELTREHLRDGRPMRAVLCNSGNANACTGPRGVEDARRMAAETARVLGIRPEEVVVASTGVIGQPLPMEKVLSGIPDAGRRLSREGSADAAEAILTTDTVPKEIAAELEVDGRQFRIGGIAKGSGMVHPDMATMLSFVTTDANIEAGPLGEVLRDVVDDTFNLISVDGETSTSDMAVCFANGQAESGATIGGSAALDVFAGALRRVMTWQARAIARDGEGATRLITVRIESARNREEARRVGRRVTTSTLVKTAVHGADANWGRILSAAATAGVAVDPDRIGIRIGDVRVAEGGRGLPFEESRAAEALSRPEVEIVIDLGMGAERATLWTCDLSQEYITINASYRT